MLVSLFVNDASPLFNDKFYDCLPQTCPVCGMPTEMSESLTGLHCSNPRCRSKVTQRLLAMANSLGVKDMGESRADAWLANTGLTNPLLMFGYEPVDADGNEMDGPMADGISLELSAKIAKQFRDRNKFTLAEYVRVANLPNIQMSAFSIFDKFDDLGEAYKAIESGGVEYIRDSLNIKESGGEDISIRALKVFESLMTFKDDLFEGLDYVEIIKLHTEGMQTLKAVCSTEVGKPFATKADFYASCNNLYPNIHIEFGSSVTKATDYLIWSGADGVVKSAVTNKVKKARAYQEKGCPIKIVTASQFLGILQSMSGSSEE